MTVYWTVVRKVKSGHCSSLVSSLVQDYNARQYVAYTLTTALSKPIYADEVIAVSAMEAVGVSAAMTKFHAIPGNPKVPFLILASAVDLHDCAFLTILQMQCCNGDRRD
jgi:hypothetical protein